VSSLKKVGVGINIIFGQIYTGILDPWKLVNVKNQNFGSKPIIITYNQAPVYAGTGSVVDPNPNPNPK
jgi:hypothetical protein